MIKWLDYFIAFVMLIIFIVVISLVVSALSPALIMVRYDPVILTSIMYLGIISLIIFFILLVLLGYLPQIIQREG